MATCEKRVQEPVPPAQYVLTMDQREATTALLLLETAQKWAGHEDAVRAYAVIKALREALGS